MKKQRGAIRVLIADDSDAVRAGIARLLSLTGEVEVCGEAGNAAEALAGSQALLPDLILLDLNMPGMSGLEAVRLLRQKMPRVRIFVISQNDTAVLLPAALKAGADDMLDKSRLAEDLIPALDNLWNALLRSHSPSTQFSSQAL